MLKNLSRPAALYSLLTLIACGGPEPLPPKTGDPQNQAALGTTPCAAGYQGTDTDGDEIPDQCEQLLGTDPNNPDCNGNGIPDGMDNPIDCSHKPADECDVACQDNKNRMYNELANSLMLGSSAMARSAPAGHTVSVDKQQMAFGPLKNITHPKFQPTLRGDSKCDTPNNVFFLVQGKVDGKAATIEFCGDIETSKLPGVTDATDKTADPLDGSSLKLWKIGNADGKKFDPGALQVNNIDVTQTFDKLNISGAVDPCYGITNDPNCSGNHIIFLNLHMELSSSYKIEFSGIYKNEEVTGKTEKIVKDWVRTVDMATKAEASYSPGYLGFWVNGPTSAPTY
ncbi:MAG TPA: hypothetical protein VI895_11920 [Bdellovibrionota bacterium]|nr:hypothetical protein [Bdellovibrionota bacterium]